MYIPFAQFYIIRIRLRFMCALMKNIDRRFVLLVDRFMLQKLPWSTVSCSANNCFKCTRKRRRSDCVLLSGYIEQKKNQQYILRMKKKTCSLSGKRKQSINELHKWGDFFFRSRLSFDHFCSFLFESMSYKKCVCSITYFYSSFRQTIWCFCHWPKWSVVLLFLMLFLFVFIIHNRDLPIAVGRFRSPMIKRTWIYS